MSTNATVICQNCVCFSGKGELKCELTCRAMGYRFYVRQAEKVIDGTPCDLNGTAVCIAGQCKVSKALLLVIRPSIFIIKVWSSPRTFYAHDFIFDVTFVVCK